MILQRDPRLRQEIQEWGCYLMSILFLVNKWTNFTLSAELINDLYKTFHKKGWIDEECTILNPNAIFSFLEMDVAYTNRHEPPVRRTRKDEIEILKFVSSYGPHFVAGDGDGHVAYDPWGVSNAIKHGRIESKRIFRRV
jgi:hypothetical protein